MLAIGVAALGFGSGLRTASGMTALMTCRPEAMPRVLGSRAMRRAAIAGSAFEIVVDKLPQTPSRLELRGLWLRLLAGAACGVLVARSDGSRPVPMALLGAASALAGAKLGHDARQALAKRYPAVLVALAEDGLAIALARVAS